jgi:facilitated trehalose transporter
MGFPPFSSDIPHSKVIFVKRNSEGYLRCFCYPFPWYKVFLLIKQFLSTAALPGITLIVGNLVTPTVMGVFGRRIANLSSLISMAISWICIIFANSVTTLLIARGLQGVGMGIISFLGPVLVGEYTSPHNRGVFLVTMSIAIAVGVLVIHTIGLYLNWATVAIICIAITIVNTVIVLFSPESPSWLAEKGRYEECKKSFRWLRGNSEDDELGKLIEANKTEKKTLGSSAEGSETLAMRIKTNLELFKQTVKKVEFYKPIIIMIHIYTMAHWSGVNIFTSYAIDLINMVIGEGTSNVSLIIITFNIQRIVSNVIAMVIIKYIKRRTMLIMAVSLNLIAMVVTAVYSYAKNNNYLPYDSPYIGLALAHIHLFSIAIGALPLSFILAGEIFPLRYKGMAGGISAITFAVNIFTAVKIAPYLFKSIGLHGTYLLLCGIILYCLIIAIVMLPETKDRTLQEIEEEFRGQKKPTDNSKI